MKQKSEQEYRGILIENKCITLIGRHGQKFVQGYGDGSFLKSFPSFEQACIHFNLIAK